MALPKFITQPDRSKWFSLIGLAAILSAVFLLFSPALKYDFVNWDDDEHLLENAAVLSLSPESITSMFRSTVNRTYIPLTSLSFAIEHHFFGFDPFVYHLDNLLLHLVVTALVFWLGLRMGLAPAAAALAAFLFGIHPMRVESVVWVTERKDVLYVLFYLLALHSYWSYLKNGRRRFYALALVSGVLSLLAKPMALSLPLILFLFDRFYGRPFDRKALLDKIPFLIYIIPIAWITYSLNARVPVKDISDAVLTWIWSFSFYLQKFTLPFDLTLFYERPSPVSTANPAYIVSIVIFLSACACVWIFRKNRWVILAAGYYFFSIFFLLRFDIFDMTIVADRFMYLPSLGLCFLFGYGVHRVLQLHEKKRLQRIIAWIAVIVLFGILSFETSRQVRVWKDNLTLWNQVLKYSPENNTAHYSRGDAYLRLKQYDLALADMVKGLRILPNLEVEYFNRGVLFNDIGRHDFALKDYEYTLLANPRYIKAYNNQAFVYFEMKQYPEAIAALSKAIEIDPEFADAFYNRALAHESLNDSEAALADYTSAIALNSNLARAYENRSRLWSEKKQWFRALSDARKAKALGIVFSPEWMAGLEKMAGESGR